MSRVSRANREVVERAYAALLDRLLQSEPRRGYSHVDQLPELTDSDLVTVLAHEEELLGDALYTDQAVRETVAVLAHTEIPLERRTTDLGVILRAFLHTEARRWLLAELREEAEWRESQAADLGVLDAKEQQAREAAARSGREL